AQRPRLALFFSGTPAKYGVFRGSVRCVRALPAAWGTSGWGMGGMGRDLGVRAFLPPHRADPLLVPAWPTTVGPLVVGCLGHPRVRRPPDRRGDASTRPPALLAAIWSVGEPCWPGARSRSAEPLAYASGSAGMALFVVGAAAVLVRYRR